MYNNMILFSFFFILVYFLVMELNNKGREIKKYLWGWKCDLVGKLRSFLIDIE